MNIQLLSERAQREHGFSLIEGPGKAPAISVPAGVDPVDGAPLAYTRLCRPDEVRLLRKGKLKAIAAGLVKDGLPGVR